MKAYCKVDFLFPVEDTIYILDWKTGKPDEKKHKKQILGYTAWAGYHFNKGLAQIRPIVAYLQPVYSELEIAIAEDEYQNFAALVKRETEEMYALCKDKEKNVPLAKDAFPQTINTKICSFCNYRELCGRNVPSVAQPF